MKWRYGAGSGGRAQERAQSSGAGVAITGLYLSMFYLSFLSFVSGDEG
jgi:hypothetical protein